MCICKRVDRCLRSHKGCWSNPLRLRSYSSLWARLLLSCRQCTNDTNHRHGNFLRESLNLRKTMRYFLIGYHNRLVAKPKKYRELSNRGPVIRSHICGLEHLNQKCCHNQCNLWLFQTVGPVNQLHHIYFLWMLFNECVHVSLCSPCRFAQPDAAGAQWELALICPHTSASLHPAALSLQ